MEQSTRFTLNGVTYATDPETLDVLRGLMPVAKSTGDSTAVMAVIELGRKTNRVTPIGAGWATLDETMAEASRIACNTRTVAYVYQTSADRFAFRFGSECDSLGVLVAIIDADTKPRTVQPRDLRNALSALLDEWQRRGLCDAKGIEGKARKVLRDYDLWRAPLPESPIEAMAETL